MWASASVIAIHSSDSFDKSDARTDGDIFMFMGMFRPFLGNFVVNADERGRSSLRGLGGMSLSNIHQALVSDDGARP